ncbi:hypothetical protein HDU93_010034, partial [Gonapodya sp. JEL0774]
ISPPTYDPPPPSFHSVQRSGTMSPPPTNRSPTLESTSPSLRPRATSPLTLSSINSHIESGLNDRTDEYDDDEYDDIRDFDDRLYEYEGPSISDHGGIGGHRRDMSTGDLVTASRVERVSGGAGAGGRGGGVAAGGRAG